MNVDELEHPPRVRDHWEYRFIVAPNVDRAPALLRRDDQDGWETVSFREYPGFEEYPDDGPVRILQRRLLTVNLEEPALGAAASHGSR